MGLRARLTVVATAVVAVGLLAGALLLVLALRAALLGGLDDAARARARDVAVLVADDRLPATLPAGSTLVQVVDGAHRVRATSPGADRLVPLLDPAGVQAVRSGSTRDLAGAHLAQDGTLRVIGAAAGTSADPLTVLVASPLAQVDDSTRVVRRGLLVGVPVLLAVVAALAWVLVGMVLRPVAQLRRGAAEISETVAGRRLPVPAARDELHRLATTLNDMLDRLDASTTRQRAFVADAAHELRSPLASARTQLEVVLAHPVGADWPETAVDVLTDVERLARLVDDLLLLARTDAGPPALRTDVDLTAVAAQVVGRHEARVTLRTDGAHVVSGDPTALARVVANLVDNAVRHAREQVVVGVREVAGEVELSVEDDGPGIAETDRARVFERFTRLDEARGRDAGGSGLGLAIARDVVVAHGGSIRLDTSPAGGLRAVVVLAAVRG